MPSRHAAAASAAGPDAGVIVLRVRGRLLGEKARLTVKGMTGAPEGSTRTLRTKGRASVRGLEPGRYRIQAKKIIAGGRTSRARVTPASVRLTRTRGAAVLVRYRLKRPARTPARPIPTPAPVPSPPPSQPPTPTSGPSPSTPGAPPALRADTLTAGGDHSCVIDTGGTAWCWGSDGSGELGDGDDGQGDEPTPVAVAGGHTWAALSAGAGHTCGIDTAGKAWCWGRDDYGQVGDGDDGQAGEPAPVPVRSLVNRTWRAIAAGWDHTCGIDTAGKAWCWGRDEFGQVGDGDDGQAAELSPVPVAGPGAVPVTWKSLSAGGYHTCGIDTAGNAWCWGSDTYGQVGDGKGNKWAPVAVVGARLWRSVAAGGYHTCGIDTAGRPTAGAGTPTGRSAMATTPRPLR